ncbi:MAG: hypothetical protein KAS66_05300 [Candidatus Omnitrophica bacterium]|nr:hypothetical protein [Candidatus Omnitrophota bacterium]
MRKVAIIGLGNGMENAPDDWERWGLPWGGDSGLDRYFEMHSVMVRPYTEKYLQKLRELEVPVMMQQEMEALPNSERFPEAALALVNDYIESSIGYMLAYAIEQEVDKIGIYGVGAPFDDHYVYQRANLEYLIGIAVGSGLSVTIEGESDLCTSYWNAGLYGFDKENLRPGTEYVN